MSAKLDAAAPPLPSLRASQLRGKTVRVMTKNGLSVVGRVVDFDDDHLNVVLDCVDGALSVTAGSDGVATVTADPPHVAPWHRELFVRGTSIRWIQLTV